MTRTCSVEGCDREAKMGRLCYGHHNRWRRYGNVFADIPLGQLSERRNAEGPTPHDKCVFTIERDENERWREDNNRRLARWDAVRSEIWHRAHAADTQMVAD